MLDRMGDIGITQALLLDSRLMTAGFPDVAATVAGIAGEFGENDTIADLNCGTGISTMALVNVYPEIGRIIGIDTSEAIFVARHKFGKSELFTDRNRIQEEFSIPLGSRYIENLHWTRRSMDHISPSIDLYKIVDYCFAWTDTIAAPHSLDAIFCFSPHRFATNGIEVNAQYAKPMLRKLASILKKGGLLVLNEDGVHFDFHEEEYQGPDRIYRGQQLNALHPQQHPYQQLFLHYVAEEVRERFPALCIDDPFKRVFDLQTIDNLIASAGLRRMKIESGSETRRAHTYVPAHRAYAVTLVRRDNAILNRLPWHHYTVLQKLPPGASQMICDNALRQCNAARSSNETAALMERTIADTYVTFVAMKE